MNFRWKQLLSLGVTMFLSACAKQAQVIIPPTVTLPPPTQTSAPPTETPTDIAAEITTETPTEFPDATDTTLFSSIVQSEIQAYSLEPVASAIFNKVMEDLKAKGNIDDYQVTSVTIYPSSDGTLYTEIIFNVQTTDSAWLEDGGSQASDNWINEKCSRFDFVTTETEFLLKNQRLCN
jgi:hypothetical protein